MPETKAKAASKKPAWQSATDDDKRIGRPVTPASLAEYGALKTPAPTSDFDPAGPWKQVYRIWMTGGAWDNLRGIATIERSATKDGAFNLNVVEELGMDRMRSLHETTVDARLTEDAIATPKKWSLTSRVFDVKTKKEFVEGTVRQSGVCDGRTIKLKTNGFDDKAKAPKAWTSNWPLFEAVQRLPRKKIKPLEFEVLDDFDTMKTDHRLTCRGEETLLFGGKPTTVTRYDEIGRGTLPWSYYVDERGRLLLALTQLRAYILDADAPRVHAADIKALAQKVIK